LAEGNAILSASALQLRFLNAERASIAELYAKGEINDEARRRIERELDLEHSRIHHSAESGGIR
jgi:monovalent cation/hydrogen antiporter